MESKKYRILKWLLLLIAVVLSIFAAPIWALWNEDVHRFLIKLEADFTESERRVIAVCRVVGWALLPLTIAQLLTAVLLAWRGMRPTWMTSNRCILLLIGLQLLTLICIIYWVSNMMPSVSLMQGMRR